MGANLLICQDLMDEQDGEMAPPDRTAGGAGQFRLFADDVGAAPAGVLARDAFRASRFRFVPRADD